MALSLQARWFKSVRNAREHHNRTCPLGPAIEVHMNPFDVRTLQWEEGDDVCGLLLVCDHQVQPDKLRIYCAGDKDRGLGTDATSVELPQPDIIIVPDYIPIETRELVPAAKVGSAMELAIIIEGLREH